MQYLELLGIFFLVIAIPAVVIGSAAWLVMWVIRQKFGRHR